MAPIFVKRYGSAKKVVDYSQAFGMIIDNDEPDPSKKITYIGKNKDYKPVTVVPYVYKSSAYSGGSYELNEWKDTFLTKFRVCMLKRDGTVDFYLKENDLTKKEDGTDSGVKVNTTAAVFEGNLMVEIPKMYVAIFDNGDGTGTVYISDKRLDENFYCWAHTDANGNEIDHFYYSKYEGTYTKATGESVYRIRSLYNYTVYGSRAQSAALNYDYTGCRNNNLEGDNIWFPELHCDRMLIDLVLMMLAKTTDLQGAFGVGYGYTTSTGVSNNTYRKSGIGANLTTNDELFVTSEVGTAYLGDTRVLGIDHYWGNIQNRLWGIVCKTKIIRVKMTYSTKDGSTVEGFENTISGGDGFIELPDVVIPTGSGLLKSFYFTKYGLFPKELVTNGDYSTCYCDMVSHTSGATSDFKTPGGLTAAVGVPLQRGMFYRSIDNSNSSGYRLTCKPYAERVNAA